MFYLCPSKSLFIQSQVSSEGSIMGLMATSFQRAYAIPSCAAPRALPLQQATADPYLLHRRHSNTVMSQSLWGLWVLVCIRFVWALWASLGSMGFDSKCDFAPPTILLELLLYFWTWVSFLEGSNILLSVVVQQRVVILEFLQEKMSASPSTPPYNLRKPKLKKNTCIPLFIAAHLQ